MRALILFLFIHGICIAQSGCDVSVDAFKKNEQLQYKIYYNWGAIWANAGEASFSVYQTQLNNIDCYHFVGLGATYPKYDWFYKVRDKYESYATISTLKPLRFKREAHEGRSYTFDDYVFSHNKGKVYTSEIRNKKANQLDSIKITKCTNDVMTAIYYVRCLDFSKYKVNDTIPVTFVLDGELFPSYVRYLGKETIDTDALGEVKCIKFKPKLIEGTIFKSGEGMTVWVTDDKNRMPVYVETPILVGSIKAKLSGFSNLKHPLESLVKRKASD